MSEILVLSSLPTQALKAFSDNIGLSTNTGGVDRYLPSSTKFSLQYLQL